MFPTAIHTYNYRCNATVASAPAVDGYVIMRRPRKFVAQLYIHIFVKLFLVHTLSMDSCIVEQRIYQCPQNLLFSCSHFSCRVQRTQSGKVVCTASNIEGDTASLPLNLIVLRKLGSIVMKALYCQQHRGGHCQPATQPHSPT